MNRTPDVPGHTVIRATAWDAPAAAALREDQQRELRALYGGDAEPGIKPSSSDVAIFLVAYQVGAGGSADMAVGCGGLRPLDPGGLGAGTAEIKRMYVRPENRGAGLSRLILAALEREALAAGWPNLVLETGTLQSAAIRLYESAGYRRIANFGHYVNSETSLCFGKALRS